MRFDELRLFRVGRGFFFQVFERLVLRVIGRDIFVQVVWIRLLEELVRQGSAGRIGDAFERGAEFFERLFGLRGFRKGFRNKVVAEFRKGGITLDRQVISQRVAVFVDRFSHDRRDGAVRRAPFGRHIGDVGGEETDGEGTADVLGELFLDARADALDQFETFRRPI